MSGPRGHAGAEPPDPRGGGPREFLAALYDAHAAGLYRYALVVLADHAAAEDAVQHAFAKLAGMGGRVHEIESCADYLRTAVRNECWRIIEKRRRRPEELETSSVTPLIEAADPNAIDEDERLRVEGALRALPAEQREVVYLKIYEGKTFQQIADWVGVSINTIASRYRYAIEKLREHLAIERRIEGKPS
jgi:RNA polymerase sigma-70 factor (ECF subfamily)